jgi:molybdopterin converting factor subunit 1
MRVKVLFFGMLKDIVGSAEEQLNVPEDAQLENIFDHYAECFPRLREMAGSIVLARNHEFSKASERVTDGDEVAFLPPVSGGSAAAGLPYTHEIQDTAGISSRLRASRSTRAPSSSACSREKTAR